MVHNSWSLYGRVNRMRRNADAEERSPSLCALVQIVLKEYKLPEFTGCGLAALAITVPPQWTCSRVDASGDPPSLS